MAWRELPGVLDPESRSMAWGRQGSGLRCRWSKRASALRSPGFRPSSGTQLGNGVDGRGEIHFLQRKQVPVFTGN